MDTNFKEFKVYDWMIYYLKLDLYDLFIFAYLFEVAKDGQYHRLKNIHCLTKFVGLSNKKILKKHLKKLTVENRLLNFCKWSDLYDDFEYSINWQRIKKIMDKISREDNQSD